MKKYTKEVCSAKKEGCAKKKKKTNKNNPKLMMGVSKVTGPKAGTRGATKPRGTGL